MEVIIPIIILFILVAIELANNMVDIAYNIAIAWQCPVAFFFSILLFVISFDICTILEHDSSNELRKEYNENIRRKINEEYLKAKLNKKDLQRISKGSLNAV